MMKTTLYVSATVFAAVLLQVTAADSAVFSGKHFCVNENASINLKELNLKLFWVESAFTRTQQLANYLNKEQRDRLGKFVSGVSTLEFGSTNVTMLQINSRDYLTYGRYPELPVEGSEKPEQLGGSGKEKSWDEKEKEQQYLAEVEKQPSVVLQQRRLLGELSLEEKKQRHPAEQHVEKTPLKSVTQTPVTKDFKSMRRPELALGSYVPNAVVEPMFNVSKLFYHALAPVAAEEHFWFHSGKKERPATLPVLVVVADQEPAGCQRSFFDGNGRPMFCLTRGGLVFRQIKYFVTRRNMALLILTTSEKAKAYFDGEAEKLSKYHTLGTLDFIYETVVVPGLADNAVTHPGLRASPASGAEAAGQSKGVTDQIISIVKSRALQFACQRYARYEERLQELFKPVSSDDDLE